MVGCPNLVLPHSKEYKIVNIALKVQTAISSLFKFYRTFELANEQYCFKFDVLFLLIELAQ